MKRREFLAASAVGLAGIALWVASQEDELKPREPDLVLDQYGGAIAFSPDSKVLAVARGPAGSEEGICFLDAENGKRLSDFERTGDVGTTAGDGSPVVMVFSPDGKYFAAGGQGYVAVWDAKTGRRLDDIVKPSSDREWGSITAIAFTSDSKCLFAGLGFWPLGQRGGVENLEELGNYEAVTFSRDGKHFATGFKGIITLWDYDLRVKQREFGHPSATSAFLAFSLDGIHLISSLVHIDRRPYFIWNITTGEPKYVPVEHFPSFDLSPDGSLFIGVIPGGAALLRIADGRTAYQLIKQSDVPKKGRKRAADHNGVAEIQFSPNQMIVAHSRRLGLKIWKEKNGFKG